MSRFEKFDLYFEREKNMFSNLALYFQPIVDIVENKVESIEALLRKIDSGVFPKNVFVNPMTRWIYDFFVVKTALDYYFLFESLGITKKIAVNVTSDFFSQDESPIEYIKHCLKENSFESIADKIEFEVVEWADFHLTERTRRNIADCVDNGIEVCFDDFGYGKTTFRALVLLPISRIKIDKELTSMMNKNNRAMKIIECFSKMQAKNEIKVIVEGVETECQYLTLKSMGIRYLQGYYIYRPSSLETMIALLEEEKEKGALQACKVIK